MHSLSPPSIAPPTSSPPQSMVAPSSLPQPPLPPRIPLQPMSTNIPILHTIGSPLNKPHQQVEQKQQQQMVTGAVEPIRSHSNIENPLIDSNQHHPAKWQRLEPTDVTSNDAALSVNKLATSYLPSPSPAVPSIPPAFNYFAAARANAARSARLDDGRKSLIPDVPGIEIDAIMAPTPKTAYEMRQEEQPCLSLGDEYLNAPLRGGLGEGITELVGEAACGKTQLAMQLLLQCQLPKSEGGLGGGALFLSMEGDFPINRLRSLAAIFKQRHANIAHDMLQKIYIRNIGSPNELWNVLNHSLRASLDNGVKLIIMDSIAAMFRTDHNPSIQKDVDFSERSQDLLRMAAQLKQYSSIYHIPVLVINQVSDFFAAADTSNGNTPLRMEDMKYSYLHHWSMMSSGRRVLPALGMTWANCVTTRIFLTRKHEFSTHTDSLQRSSQSTSQPYQSTSSMPSSVDTHGLTPLVNMFTPSGSSSSANWNAYTQAATPRPSISQQQSMSGSPPPTHIRRFLTVQFSPHLPQSTAEFIIETGGIRGTSTLPPMINSPPSSQHSPLASSSPTISSMPYANTRLYASPPSTIAPSSVPLYSTYQPTSYSARPPPAAVAPSPPSTSYIKNMYTPAGGAKSKYFDDEDDFTQADQDAMIAAAAEAELRRAQQPQQPQQKPYQQQQQQPYFTTGAPVLRLIDVVNSPMLPNQKPQTSPPLSIWHKASPTAPTPQQQQLMR